MRARRPRTQQERAWLPMEAVRLRSHGVNLRSAGDVSCAFEQVERRLHGNFVTSPGTLGNFRRRQFIYA